MMSHVHDPSLPPAYAAPPRKGWFGRNWLWFIPSIVLLPICLCGGLCGGGFLYLRQTVVNSGAYALTLEKLRENAEVKAALGEPIEETWMTMGGVNMTSDQGSHATLMIRVQGSKAGAMVESESRQAPGVKEWELTRLIVRPDGGSPIVIAGGPEVLPDQPLDREVEPDEDDMPADGRPTEESETESPELESPPSEAPAEEAPAEVPATDPAAEEKPE